MASNNDGQLAELTGFRRHHVHLSNKSATAHVHQHSSNSDKEVNKHTSEQSYLNNHLENYNEFNPKKLKRLTLDWTSPYFKQIKANATAQQKAQPSSPASQYKIMQTNDNSLLIIAELMHLILRQISLEGMASWSATSIKQRHNAWRNTLLQKGLSNDQLEAAFKLLTDHITLLLADPRGQWLFAKEHQDNSIEHSFSTVINGKIVRSVLDRSFIDDQDVRWLICYPMASVTPESFEFFLNEQQKFYHKQLLPYAKKLRENEHRLIRMGLYFPLLNAWHEWSVA